MPIDEKVLEKARVGFVGARVRLGKEHPFWAHLVMKMDVRWMEFEQPGGMPGLTRTDGEHLDINPTVFASLSGPERISTLVHEAAHCAAGHLFRRGSREPVQWNIAGDVYIANMQKADGFVLPKGCEEFFRGMRIDYTAFSGMPTEAIYDKLPKSCKQGGGGGKNKGQGGCEHWNGQGCFEEGQTSKQRAEGEAKWKQAVIEASQVAGNQPGAYDELIKAALPKPPFQLKMFEYMNRGIGGDTTWESLNRRFIHEGMYLPTDTKMVMGEMAVAVDTSGSMSSEQLALAFGYIRAFREQHPCKLHLIQCDYDAVSAGQYKCYDDYEQLPSTFKAVGRGGTQFDPPFKLLREKRVEPKVMIYLTDGYGGIHSEKKPGYPVLWVVLKGDAGFKPPFGDVVVVK